MAPPRWARRGSREAEAGISISASATDADVGVGDAADGVDSDADLPENVLPGSWGRVESLSSCGAAAAASAAGPARVGAPGE